MKTARIGVSPGAEYCGYARLLDALERAFSVEFKPLVDDNSGYDAALLLDATPSEAEAIGRLGLRCLAFLGGPRTIVNSSGSEVVLSASKAASACFRGRKLPEKAIPLLTRLVPEAGDEVVARRGSEYLWLQRKTVGATVDIVATEAPRLLEGEHIFKYWHRDNWSSLLPVVQFLREVSLWEPAPLRACFIFDDPNLHWTSYGYFNFHHLVRHASDRHYHVAFASVPLDSWFIHRDTASLFHRNRENISLLVHGNNHTYLELARNYSATDRVGLARQALRRAARLERAVGFEIPRIMIAPHEACSEEMAESLLHTGWKAACISRGSLMHFNQNKVWPASFGLNMAEFLAGGMPVLPRFKQSANCEIEICLAAMAGKPIILGGHQGEIAQGLDLLGELAQKVNSVGDVRWADMQSLMEGNFSTKRQRNRLYLTMHSRDVRLTIPEGINELWVRPAWLPLGYEETLRVRAGDSKIAFVDDGWTQLCSVLPGQQIKVDAVSLPFHGSCIADEPRTPLRAIARRIFCEVRDRVKPSTDRVRRSLFGKN